MTSSYVIRLSLLVLIALVSSASAAAPANLTYQGRILKSDGSPLEYSSVSFLFQILDPSGTCLIYQEQVDNYNMASSNGVFDVPIGEGTVQFPLVATTIHDAFNNTTTFTCGTCTASGASYSCANDVSNYPAVSTDGRKLRVSFYDGTGWSTISPVTEIRSVPFASYALSAEKLGNNAAADFILKSLVPVCGANTYLSWDGTNLTCEPVSGTAGGTVTDVTSANTDIAVANTTSTPVLTLNSGTAGGAGDANKIAKLDGSGLLTTAIIPNLPSSKITGLSNLSVLTTDNSGVLQATTGSVNGSILQYSATGPLYSTASFPTSTTANQLLYSSANNVVGGLATANNSILTTNGAGVPSWATTSTDTFTQYALLAGRAGGQTLSGGNAASENLVIESTSHGTKGYVSIAPSGDYVGIGTNSPGTPLDIQRPTAANDATFMVLNLGAGTDATHGPMLLNFGVMPSATGGNRFAFIGAGDTSAMRPLALNTNGAGSFGMVGIGTDQPGSKLHITDSNTSIGALTTNVNIQAEGSAGIDNGGMITFSGDDGASSGRMFGAISARKENATVGNHNGYLQFATRVNGTVLTEKMRIASNGNVGIGTTAPDRLLSVGPGVAGSVQVPDGGAGNALPQIVNAQTSGTAGIAVGVIDGTRNNRASFFVNDTLGLWGLSYTYGTGGYPFIITDSGMERLRIDTTGQVGIGTDTPSYTLHVVGTAGLSTGTAWTNASDLRLKDIHGDYEHGLNEVLQLHTVRYNYKKDNPLGLPSDFGKTGFIAQEVQKVIPEAVNKRDDGYLEINVDPIHWAVVNAIKEFYKKWFDDSQSVHREIASLKAENKMKNEEIQNLKNYICSKDPKAPFCF